MTTIAEVVAKTGCNESILNLVCSTGTIGVIDTLDRALQLCRNSEGFLWFHKDGKDSDTIVAVYAIDTLPEYNISDGKHLYVGYDLTAEVTQQLHDYSDRRNQETQNNTNLT